MHRWIIFGLLACGLAACSGDDDDTSGSGGTGAGATGGASSGGTGAGGSGGATTGGASTGGAATGGSGGTPAGADCPGMACSPDSIVLDGTPFLEFPACCSDEASDTCGLDVTAAADLLGGVTGCMETARPGPLDAACPNETIDIVGTAVELPGCCQEDGVCGLQVDVTALGSALGATGPDFGCQDGEPFIEGYTPTACGG